MARRGPSRQAVPQTFSLGNLLVESGALRRTGHLLVLFPLSWTDCVDDDAVEDRLDSQLVNVKHLVENVSHFLIRGSFSLGRLRVEEAEFGSFQ